MNWLWLNISLMAAFFLAMTGIPLWLVFKHPDQRQSAEASLALTTPITPTTPKSTVGRRTHDGDRFARPSLARAGR